MSRRLALLVALMLPFGCRASCSDETPTPMPPSECGAPALRDDSGAVLILRGASVSAESKWSDDLLPPFEAHDLEHLRDDLGMNAIRLLVFWEAIEPYPGDYDEAYLDAVRHFVEMADGLGLHVLVDMHQDVYGRGFGQAGAPRWTCDEDLYDSFEEREPWFLGYLEREVGQCFDQLYREGPVRTAFVGAWTRLAEHLAGSGVFAYDVLNEPFWGSTSASRFEREVLPDFYRELIDAIRVVDPDPWVMVEPAPSTNVGVRSELGAIERERIIYGPHFYPAAIELGSGYHGKQELLREQVRSLCADAERLEAPVVVGELGVRRNVDGAEAYLRDLYDAFDAAQVSALYWSYERGKNGSYGVLDAQGAPAVQGLATARPYPRRVAGDPDYWHWDPVTRAFTMTWDESFAAAGDTVVSLPRLAFPEGLTVQLDRPDGETPHQAETPDETDTPDETGPAHRLTTAAVHVPRRGGKRRLVVRSGRPEPPPQPEPSAPPAAPRGVGDGGTVSSVGSGERNGVGGEARTVAAAERTDEGSEL